MTSQSQAHENAYGCITHLVRPGSQLKTLLRLGTRRVKLPPKPMLIPIGPPFAIIYADCHCGILQLARLLVSSVYTDS